MRVLMNTVVASASDHTIMTLKSKEGNVNSDYKTQHSYPRSSSRREWMMKSLIAIPAVASALVTPPAAFSAASPPSPPVVGDCTDCIGPVNNTLNACSLESNSCISTLNDDEAHFQAPWQYDESTPDAIDRLISVATGGAYEPGLINEPFGVSKLDAAEYIVKGVWTVVTNQVGKMPQRPQRRRMASFQPFDGQLVERKKTENGSEYVRITFGLGDNNEEIDPVDVIDAEFLFLKDDNIVNVRAASRADPDASLSTGKGELALSFTNGLVIDRNVAKRKLEVLRTALTWDLVAVLTDFDPKFNPETPVVVDKIFRPFSDTAKFKPSGVPYPYSE